MTASVLFAHLVALGCRLRVTGEQLRVYDPHGALTPMLRQAIRNHKTALRMLLAPRVCLHCQCSAPPGSNLPELLCSSCGAVIGYLTPTGVEVPEDPLPITQGERAALTEYEAGLSRREAETLALARLPREGCAPPKPRVTESPGPGRHCAHPETEVREALLWCVACDVALF